MSQEKYENLRDGDPALRQKLADAARLTILQKKHPRDRKLQADLESARETVATHISRACAEHGEDDHAQSIIDYAHRDIDPLAEKITSALAKPTDRAKFKSLIRIVIVNRKSNADSQQQSNKIFNGFLSSHLGKEEISLVHDLIHVLQEHDIDDLLADHEPAASTFRR